MTTALVLPPADASLTQAVWDRARRQVEEDVLFEANRLEYEAIRRRVAEAQGHLVRLVEEVTAGKDLGSAVSAIVAVEAVRSKMTEWYASINPALAASADGKARIEGLVGKITDGLLRGLEQFVEANLDPLRAGQQLASAPGTGKSPRRTRLPQSQEEHPGK